MDCNGWIELSLLSYNRDTPHIIATSLENIFEGTPCPLLSSLPVSLETRSSLSLTRHSSYTWLREVEEEEESCLLASQLRRRYEEVRRAAVEQSQQEQGSQQV